MWTGFVLLMFLPPPVVHEPAKKQASNPVVPTTKSTRSDLRSGFYFYALPQACLRECYFRKSGGHRVVTFSITFNKVPLRCSKSLSSRHIFYALSNRSMDAYCIQRQNNKKFVFFFKKFNLNTLFTYVVCCLATYRIFKETRGKMRGGTVSYGLPEQ